MARAGLITAQVRDGDCHYELSDPALVQCIELLGELTQRTSQPPSRALDCFDAADPDVLATAIAEEIGRPVDYREVETDGARRAAEKLAELL